MKTLFTNARVITMDRAMAVHDRGWVLVDGSRIAAIGSGDSPATDGAEIVELAGDILMPGMVNTHCHLAMSLFRGLGEDVDDRLFRYILPLERQFVSPAMVRAGTALSVLESIMGGVTTLADMYYHEVVIGEVIAEAGLRGVVGQTLGDFEAPDHKSFAEGFALAEELFETFRDHPLVTPSIAPHAPYSTGPAVLERVARWAAERGGVPIQIHLAETDAETEWAQANHGLSPVALTAKTGVLGPGTIAAHCLNLSDADVEILASTGASVAHNARSNGKAGRGMARVEDMRRAGIRVGIATDGPMSGNTLDLFSQFAPVSIFAKILGHSRKPLPATEVLRMATIEGAEALGMGHETGSLEIGKKADIIRIDLSAPRFEPLYDPFAALVFAAMPTDVRDVMVDGRWIMRAREVQTLERTRVMADARQVADAFRAEIVAIDAARHG